MEQANYIYCIKIPKIIHGHNYISVTGGQVIDLPAHLFMVYINLSLNV